MQALVQAHVQTLVQALIQVHDPDRFKLHYMELQFPIQGLLLQLQDVLERMDDAQYTTRVEILSGATTGQHVRHVLEFLEELQNGYDSGLVNYDRRRRSLELETSRHAAVRMLTSLVSTVDRPEKDLMVAADVYGSAAADGSGFGAEGAAAADAMKSGGEDAVVIRTNYSRELLYNIEHIVHHMALLRVAISVVAGSIRLPAGFGVAASTLKYRQRCAS